MADGGVASADTGVEGRDQVMQADNAFVGIHPKAMGSLRRVFSRRLSHSAIV